MSQPFFLTQLWTILVDLLNFTLNKNRLQKMEHLESDPKQGQINL